MAVAEESISLFGDFAYDVSCRLRLRHETDALSGPKRHCINVAFGISPRRVGLIAYNGTNGFRRADHFPFSRPFTGSRTTRRFPSLNCLVSKRTMRRIRPTDVEQVVQIDCVYFIGLQNTFAITRVNCGLVAGKKSSANPNACRAEG